MRDCLLNITQYGAYQFKGDQHNSVCFTVELLLLLLFCCCFFFFFLFFLSSNGIYSSGNAVAVSVSRLTQESNSITFWKGCVFESQFCFFFFGLFFLFFGGWGVRELGGVISFGFYVYLFRFMFKIFQFHNRFMIKMHL